MRKTATIATIALAAALLTPSIASADWYEMRYNSGGSFVAGTQYQPHYYAFVNGQRQRMLVGMLNLRYRDLDGGAWQALPTFCAQPDQYLALPATYHVEDLANVTANPDAIARLWDAKYQETVPTADRPDRSLEAAAFQTLVWEFAKDGDFDLSSGSFRLDMNHAATASVATLASTWYTEIANWVGQASLAVMFSADSQNQLAVLPAPAGPLLSLAGLSGVLVLRRRRG